MAGNLRLNKIEEENLRKRCVEINKILVKNEKMPLRESELAHFLLESTLKHVKADKQGNIFIDI